METSLRKQTAKEQVGRRQRPNRVAMMMAEAMG